MSPDARLIAASVILSQRDQTADECAADVAALEAALAPTNEPGIRGMVPVAWVSQMLDELFSVAAQVTPQPVPVADKIISIRAQLAQFREDS